MSSLIYILDYYVFLFFIFMSLLLWFAVKQDGLLSISMLNVIPKFAILCFHMFDKMTMKRILKKNKKKQKKNKDGHVEEQIGRTNVEEYYYVSKLHS